MYYSRLRQEYSSVEHDGVPSNGLPITRAALLDREDVVADSNGIAENTFYRWRKTYGGMSVSEAQRLKELEKENTRLKRLLAERMLEVDALKQLLRKKA
jgi:transposase-like protein